jgi:sugar (pentulose or hexulose) kinase
MHQNGQVIRDATRTPIACGIDIGSTNMKVVGLLPTGEIVARAQRQTPRNSDDLSIDLTLVLRLAEDMLIEAAGSVYAVQSVCAVGVGEDGSALDAGFAPTARALAWFDPRRTRLFESIRRSLPEAPGAGVRRIRHGRWLAGPGPGNTVRWTAR